MRERAIIEQLENDKTLAYVKELKKYVVKNPLVFQNIETEVEEWRNIPSLVARYCIILHDHLKELVNYN